MPEVVYLAHRINKEGLQPTDDKVRAVREFPQPGRVGRLKAVLWMLSDPINNPPRSLYIDLLQKTTPWEWKNKHHKPLHMPRKLWCLTPYWYISTQPRNYLLACDASPYGIGAVLVHRMPDWSERPIAYASQTPTPAERNYAHIEKEGLAIVKHFHCYLYGRHFTIHSSGGFRSDKGGFIWET